MLLQKQTRMSFRLNSVPHSALDQPHITLPLPFCARKRRKLAAGQSHRSAEFSNLKSFLEVTRSVVPICSSLRCMSAADQTITVPNRTLLCTSITSKTFEEALEDIQMAATSGVDVVELRVDFLQDFDPETHIELLLKACPLPAIFTYRPVWEGCVHNQGIALTPLVASQLCLAPKLLLLQPCGFVSLSVASTMARSHHAWQR
jgi:Type I 3-dehydroquinase